MSVPDDVADGSIRGTILACGAIASGVAATATFLAVANSRQTITAIALIVSGGVAIIAAALMLWIVGTGILLGERTATAREEKADAAVRQADEQVAAQLAEPDGLSLVALWQATQARLDRYHVIATEQARKSFRNAQFAMAAGFVLLFIFAVQAISTTSTAASIVLGALGATSAGLAGYIGRTFVRVQESAANHLRTYFGQPVEFSRYLVAERLLTMSNLGDEERAAILAAFTQVIQGSGAPVSSDPAWKAHE
jgi:Cyanobacterial TRADD-N associated 2-Transmembrane domain